MIVMDTSKLKGLGIESTIKNAMSKLEKGKNKKPNQPISKPTVNDHSIPSSSTSPKSVIKTEIEPKTVSTHPKDTVIKHKYRAGGPFTKSISTTNQVLVQPNSMPHTTRPVVHLIRSSHSSTVSPSNVVIQSVKLITPQVPATINIVQSTSVPVKSNPRVQPSIINSTTSTIPTSKPQHSAPIQTNCSSKMVQSQTIDTDTPLINTESNLSSTSDGKKIKILSDVSLNDGKAKLLEIDKLSSKNLKLTNVIKGTDKTLSKPTIHSTVNPEFTNCSRPSVPFKAEIDKMSSTKFTNVHRAHESQSCSSNSVRQPEPVYSASTIFKPLRTGTKVSSSVNLNINDGINKSATKPTYFASNCTNQPISSSSTSAMPTNIENRKAPSKFLKIPAKILNFSNNKEAYTPKSPFPKLSFKPPSHSKYKPSSTIGIDNISTRNVIFTNAMKSTVFTSSASKQSTPMYSASVPTKSERGDIKHNETNLPHYKTHYKGAKEYPLQTPAYKIIKPDTAPTSSTSPSIEVLTKKLVTTDENIEIIIPKRQKYLCTKDKSGSHERTSIYDTTKPFQDVLWATNNPRTYARHNVKRLLSDKIIKKTQSQTQSQEESVQNVQTSEISVPVETDKKTQSQEESVQNVQTSGISVPVETDKKTQSQEESVQNVQTSGISVPVETDKKTQSQEESVQNVQTSEISVLVETKSGVQNDASPVECGTKPENVKSVFHVEPEPICCISTTNPTPVDPTQYTDLTKPSGTVSENNFYGFPIEETNASASVLNQIKAILSTKRTMVAPKVENKNANEIKTVDCDNDNLILNSETGLLEETNKDVPMVVNSQNVSPPSQPHNNIERELSQENAVFESGTMEQISSAATPVLNDAIKVRLNATTLDDSPVPTKLPVIEDADDEISDIDLAHRSKCKGNTLTPKVKNRRAILKSVELHRKAFMPATTDDESERSSLCVRPPRPKVRKFRQKQTVEQLKIQQSAYVNLLKRFTQTNADSDILNDESLVYFIDGVDERIKVLQDQVECCFNTQNRDDLNLEDINFAEQIVSNDPVTDKIESVKTSEIITLSNEIQKPSESSSSEKIALNCVVPCEPQPHHPTSDNTVNNAGIADSEKGLSMTHEVTIQKDTFLVTECNNQSDKINHLPLKIKQEKETSPQPSSSVTQNRNKKHTRATIRKKRKRKSLLEMLAQHIDQDTLKSVILAHAKQKCDFSSSTSDSDSDNEERSDEASDIVSKIFRTVCTIDLCDDDDETLHDDVLQYLQEPEETETDPVSITTPSYPDKLQPSLEHHKLSEQTKNKVIPETCSTVADISAISENAITNSNVCKEVGSVNSAKDPHEITSPAPLTNSAIEPESYNVDPFDDVEMIDATVEANSTPIMDDISTEKAEAAIDAKSSVDVPMENISKLDDMHDVSGAKEPDRVIGIEVKADGPVRDGTSTTAELEKDISNSSLELNDSHDPSPMREPERAMLKLRPFEQISSRSNPKNENNDTTELSTNKKLKFEEILAEADSVITKKSTSKKSKRKVKISKSKHNVSNEKKSTENSVELSVFTLESNTSSKPAKPPSDDKVQFSSVSVNDDSALGAIKIKIKLEGDSDVSKIPISTSSDETLNDSSKPSRYRKRKCQVLEVAITTPIQSKRTRPMFDYFDAPEILTTKRTRKSKSSYVHDGNRNESVQSTATATNQRTPRRKSTTSKIDVETDVPKLESTIEKEKDQKEATITEPVEPVTQPNLQANLTIPKSGRGVRPPVLAPLNIAAKYVCGNCKEEVVAKAWTKHIASHYGLAWRVNVDPPIDMDNIHTMSSKVMNFTKKANIRILKCQKCNVEKKSALGYLSHLEVCGLTPEEIKSKLVKCEYCPSMIRNCSMKIHLTFCSGLKRLEREKEQENELTKEDENSEECYNEIGRAVRRSAQKARSSFKDIGKPPEAKVEDYVERVHKVSNKQHRKWRQLLKEYNSIKCVRNGCEFTTDNTVAMTNHFNVCVLIDGETFFCNRCDHGPDTRAAVEEHIKANHSLGVIESIDDKDFSDSDVEAEISAESSESEGESGDEEISERGEDEECNYDDDDDGWNAKGYKKQRIRDWGHHEVLVNSCLDRKVLAEYSTLLKTSYSGGSYFHPTLEWTHDFRDKHFSSKDILPFATPNKFSVLSSSLTNLYLPRITISNRFLVKDVQKYKKKFGSTVVNKSDDWQLLKRFEATKYNCSVVLFTGGPVLSMAWLPVPDDHLSQILAVCCRKDANDDILLNNTKPTKCLIQIWNFDKLKNGQLRQAQTPNLLYSIAYDHGPVIQMEFCPSGGFTDDRLGLLAVTSYDGHVDILALPKNFTSDDSTIENLVFKIQPSLTLCCEQDQPLGVLLTKLAWSQSKGHTKLAGGYSNGLVAIWNLKNLETPYICRKVNGVPTLIPTDLFYAGNKAIRLLEFHHDETNEARWLIAGSHDRKVKFIDTHNVYLEISTTVAHSRIVAGCWPMHWSSFLLGIDNAYSLKVSGIVVKQPLDIGCRTATFYSIIGSTCDISFNNWLNAYAFVTSYGDIHVGYVRQMISGFCETRRQRSILGYTDSVNIEQSNSMKSDVVASDEPVASNKQVPSTSSTCTLEETVNISYPSTDGIIFCDFQNPLPAVTSPSYEKIGSPPMNSYNLVKVNRILFNPNVSAFKLYAVGYEAGFVRINQLMPK